MISERPKRIRKPKMIWEATESSSAAYRPKNASRTVKTDVLIPIAVELLPRPSKLNELLPIYTPPFQIKKKQGKPSFERLSALKTFQKFIDCEIIGRIGTATNAYAARARAKQSFDEYQQNWHPTTSGELYRYLGVWLYMSLHPELRRVEFWSETHRLGRYLSRNRFEQLHRYFLLRDETSCPRQPHEGFAWKLEPITAILRANCKRNWIAGTHFAVNELIIPFCGRTKHKVKMKNKPIDEKYKV